MEFTFLNSDILWDYGEYSCRSYIKFETLKIKGRTVRYKTGGFFFPIWLIGVFFFLACFLLFLRIGENLLQTECKRKDWRCYLLKQVTHWGENLRRCIVDQDFLNLSVQKNFWENELKHRFPGPHSWDFEGVHLGLAQASAFLINDADSGGPEQLCGGMFSLLCHIQLRDTRGLCLLLAF